MMTSTITRILLLVSLVLRLASPRELPTSYSEYEDELVMPKSGLRIEGLIVKGQIGYHFRKTVNEIVQDFFLARTVSLEPVTDLVDVLVDAGTNLGEYCKPDKTYMAMGPEVIHKGVSHFPLYDPRKPSFMAIKDIGEVSVEEAKKICSSLGMRLPEVYTEVEKAELVEYLKNEGIESCFTGLEMDFISGFWRFSSTGLPIWKGLHSRVYSTRKPNESYPVEQFIEQMNVDFIYADDGELHFYRMKNERPVFHGLSEVGKFFTKGGAVFQLKAKVVCAQRVQSIVYGPLYRHQVRDNRLTSRRSFQYYPGPQGKRNATYSDDTREYEGEVLDLSKVFAIENGEVESSNMTAVRTWDEHMLARCRSSKEQLDFHSHQAMTRLTALLSLVSGPSGNYNTQQMSRRGKAFSTIAKILARAGYEANRSLQDLFDRIPEDTGSSNRTRVTTEAPEDEREAGGSLEANPNQSMTMAKALKEYAVLVEPFALIPTEDSAAVYRLRTAQKSLIDGTTRSRLQIESLIDLILSSAEAVARTMDRAICKLTAIVEESIKGKTDVCLLDAEFSKKVKAELAVRGVIAELNRNIFEKMSSVTIDPDNDEGLVVLMSGTAINPENLELIQLIPVPAYARDRAYSPKLDYEYAVLNQKAGTYRSISAVEAERCVKDDCRLAGIERAISSIGCGLPQLFGMSPLACEYSNSHTDGIYFMPVPPEGVIYSLREDARGQLICQNNRHIGKPVTLSGMGIMHILPGCTMVFTDPAHLLLKVKGSPTFHLTDAAGIEAAEASIKKLSSHDSFWRNVSTTELERATISIAGLQNSMKFGLRQIFLTNVKLWSITLMMIFMLGFLLINVQLLRSKFNRAFKDSIALRNPAWTMSQLQDVERLKSAICDLSGVKANLAIVQETLARLDQREEKQVEANA